MQLLLKILSLVLLIASGTSSDELPPPTVPIDRAPSQVGLEYIVIYVDIILIRSLLRWKSGQMQ